MRFSKTKKFSKIKNMRQNSPKKDIYQTFIFIFFNLLLTITPFIFTAVNEELFEFNKMLFTYGLSILILAAWIWRCLATQTIIFKRTKLDGPIFLFLVSQVFATVLSIHPFTSWQGYYTRFHGGLLSTLTYLGLFYAFVSNISLEQTKILLRTGLIAAVGASLYALPEHFGHSFSCLIITHKFNTACWIQDVQNRIFGSFGQPNWLAAYLIMLLPVSWTMFLTRKAKNGAVIASTLLFTTLLFTKSRSGLLGLGAGLIIFLIGLFLAKKKVQLNKKIIILGLSWLMPLLIFGSVITPSIFKFKPGSHKSIPAKTTTAQNSAQNNKYQGTESGEIRKIVWAGALKVWQRYPFFGSGVGTFAYSYYQDRPLAHNLVSEWDFLYNKAHNEFLNFLATTGLVGLVSYCLLLAMIFYQVWLKLKAKQIKHEQKTLIVGLAAGLAGLIVSNFFGFSTVMVGLLMFVFAAMIVVLGQQKSPTRINFNLPQPVRLITMIMTGVIALHLLISTVNTWQADYFFTQGKSLIRQEKYELGLEKLQAAVLLAPRQALFYDELAQAYADIALRLSLAQKQAEAQEFAQTAIDTSNYTLRLNPRHLSFYKSRARLFMTLAQLDLEHLEEAKQTLLTAVQLAPTEPKLIFDLAMIELAQQNEAGAIDYLEEAIELKPNYTKARYELALVLEQSNQLESAKQHYQTLLELVPTDQNVQARLEAVEASLSAQPAVPSN